MVKRMSKVDIEAVDSESLVLDFLGSWKRGDIDEIMSFISPEAVYHNVPVHKITGVSAIREIFASFLEAFDEAELEVKEIVASPKVVFAERVDRFLMKDGKRVNLPVTGVFEITDGKISRFSDYFDLKDFETQSGIAL